MSPGTDPIDPAAAPAGPTDAAAAPAGPPEVAGAPVGPPDEAGAPARPPDAAGAPAAPPEVAGAPAGPPDVAGAPAGPPDVAGAPAGAGDAPVAADRAVKRRRLLELLDERGADRLLLTSATALSWYLDGARVHVSLAGDPIAAVVVGREGDEWRVFANEADRLLAEELPHDPAATLTRVPWHEPLAADLPGALREPDVSAELRAARASLLPGELARYRALCREVAEVLTDAAAAAHPEQSERDVAATLAAGLAARGIDPLVTLVAGRSRLVHRHPLPTAAPIGDRAMLVVCGRRHGLIANATRWLRFGAADPAEADAERRILEVEAAFLDATVPGAALGDAFAAGIAAYRASGFAADEWRNHHQGGAAGYAGRDPRAVPGIADRVQPGQPFAWNPTAPGAKVEDTVLVGPDGVDPLTVDPRWPTTRVAGRIRPITLQL